MSFFVVRRRFDDRLEERDGLAELASFDVLRGQEFAGIAVRGVSG